MFYFIVLLLFGLATAIVAGNKGRSAIGWFIIGFFLGPVGLVIAIFVPGDEIVMETKATSDHGSKKKCPYCAELVKKEAIICKHCGKDISTAAPEKDGIARNTLSSEEKRIAVDIEGYQNIGELEHYANLKGYSKAKYMLSMLFFEGDLVEQDMAVAKKWLQKAADEGYQPAIDQLSDDM